MFFTKLNTNLTKKKLKASSLKIPKALNFSEGKIPHTEFVGQYLRTAAKVTVFCRKQCFGIKTFKTICHKKYFTASVWNALI